MTPLGWIVFVGWPVVSLALAVGGLIHGGPVGNTAAVAGGVSIAAYAVYLWIVLKGFET
jgi:hypothetical protein